MYTLPDIGRNGQINIDYVHMTNCPFVAKECGGHIDQNNGNNVK